jgi:hypothetical protein
MNKKKSKLSLFCLILLFFGFSAAAFGDWNEGDPYKMHYPQLPKAAEGLDVALFFTNGSQWLADDWLCTQTGPVSDIHFWVSWFLNDVQPIDGFSISIWSDNPTGLFGYSQPLELLWARDFFANDITVRPMTPQPQGWFDPYSAYYEPFNHDEWAQVNITDIPDPFIQQQGEVYWLMIDVWNAGYIGWKQSESPHFRDNAVYFDFMNGWWMELYDPMTLESMDLAFVITSGEEKVVKWEQPPCLDDPDLCMDVDATEDMWMTYQPQVLADDFLCSNTGPITDIHLWGSWLFDYPPNYDPNYVWFTLCLYSNNPSGPYGWSEPDQLLWWRDFYEGDFDVEWFADGYEGFYIPCEGSYWSYADFTCWKYNFYIDPGEAFVQQEGTIYWLAVQAHIYDPQPVLLQRFGWKNSPEHWNDDAVWTVGILPYDLTSPWVEMLHPITMESMDLAFQITTSVEEVPKPAFMPHTKWSQPPIEKSPQEALLYASSPGAGTSSLSTVDPYTGLVTIIGPFIGAAAPITEIEWSQDGSTLYGTTGGGASIIHTIDPTTGIILSSVVQNPAGGALQGLEFDASGTLLGTHVPFGGGPSDLVTVDTITGLLTTIGPTGFGPIGGLAFDSGFNTLYGITSGQVIPPILLSVNPSTGVATQIAVTTISTYAGSLEFTADGRLVTAGGDGNFYEINPGNGVATLIGPMVNEPILSGLSLRPTYPVNCGWDEESNDAFDPGMPIIKAVADDFHCIGSMPITSIHWWGSFFDWEWSWAQGTLPPVLPARWWIGFWSNVPANMPPNFMPYSYPDILLHSVTIPANRVDFTEIGSDEYLGMYPYDICYQYNVELEPEEFFWQDDFNEMTYDDIYWISIVAEYDDEPYYRWGWKTRPDSWKDDAVTFFLQFKPPEGFINDPWSVIPLEDPYWYQSVDVSFELDTDPNYIKWEQLFTGIRDWPHYEDIFSMAFANETTVTKYIQQPDLTPTGTDVLAGPLSVDQAGQDVYEVFLADDFICTQTGPVTDIHIWASYNQDIMLDTTPSFSLVIYDNIPADESPTGYSMPGAPLWDAYLQPTYYGPVATADEFFYDPNRSIIGFDTLVWRFDFDIDPAEAFVQQEGEIYWLGIHHSFDLSDDGIVDLIDLMLLKLSWPGVFGWKTSLEHFEDDAVWTKVMTFAGSPHVVPAGLIWGELRYPSDHPLAGQSIDLAFELTTQQQQPDIIQLAADDWLCERRTPVTAITWWGSYFGYMYETPCITDIIQPPPVPPDYFLISIYKDVPADYPGNQYPYSHPGRKLWEYRAYDYDEVFVGYDKHPIGAPGPHEPVYRYSVRLPEDKWFKQREVNGIYWISILAVYRPDVQLNHGGWGWTNHPYVFGDDAVMGYPVAPDDWMWYEVFDQTGASADLSFMLFTDPGVCINCADYNWNNLVTFYDYAIFALDWLWSGLPGGYANGDLDCNGDVNFADLQIFCQQWLQSCP